MVSSEKVTIIGAGPAGVVAALYLARRGLSVTVYESRPDPRSTPLRSGRSINMTITARGWRALQDVGVADEIMRLAMPLHGRMIHFENGDTTYQAYGRSNECIFAISRVELIRHLLTVAEAHPRIEVNFDHRFVHIDPKEGVLELVRHDQQRVRRDDDSLVLAADGCNSSVRAQLLQTRCDQFVHHYSPYLYKEIYLPARFSGSVFDAQCTHVWPRNNALIVAFPNKDGSFVGSVFMPLSGGELSFASIDGYNQLAAVLEKFFPDLVTYRAELEQGFFSCPLGTLLSLQCAPWTWNGRFALIGDAAHSMVPFLGQGMNAGLEDCTILDQGIDMFGLRWDLILPWYERVRKPDCDAVTVFAQEHFQELAKNLRDPKNLLRSRIEQELYERYPKYFIPVYTLITFTGFPYSAALHIAERQRRLVDSLLKLGNGIDVLSSEAGQCLLGEFLRNTASLPSWASGSTAEARERNRSWEASTAGIAYMHPNVALS